MPAPTARPPPPPTPPTPIPPTLTPAHRCFRCGYDRLGLAPDRICPVCGALPADAERACAACGQGMAGLEPDARCPACGTVQIAASRPCVTCGYNLRGLPVTRDCPECGTPLVRSLRGNMLAYAAPEYLAKLHSGVVLVEVSLAMSIGLMGAMIVAVRAAGQSNPAVELMGSMVGLGISLVALLGWWRVSEPDPGLTGVDVSITARRVLRVAVGAGAVLALLHVGLSLAISVRGGPMGPLWTDPLAALSAVVAGLVMVAWFVQFFASMQHIRWLARRMPDQQLHNSAKRFLWLGPLLYTVGILLLCLGPLIALVMYVSILDLTRRDLKRIRGAAGAAQDGHPPASPT